MAVGIIQGSRPTQQTQIFPSHYFTGADVSIYFGDVFVDEIVDLEFALQEPVLPLKGYASHTFHRVARGARTIQGSFTINFKSNAYLYMILDHLGRMHGTQYGAVPYLSRMLNQDHARDLPEWIARAQENIEALLDRTHKPKIVSRTPERWYVPLGLGDAHPSTKDTDPAWNQKKESVEYLKQALVRRGFLTAAQAATITYFDETLRNALTRFQQSMGFVADGRMDLTDSQALTEYEYDRPPDGLDPTSRAREIDQMIWGTGYTTDPDARYRPYFHSGEFTSLLTQTGFDIYIIYGVIDRATAVTGNVPASASFPYTVKAIFGVQLTGCEQVITADGQHILERYTFIARDLDINSGTSEEPPPASPRAKRRMSPAEVIKTPSIPSDAKRVNVVKVIDGDTFELSDGRRVRIIGVNAPELTTKKPYSMEAKTFLESLIGSKSVWIRTGVEPKDSYGRDLCWVWTEDGKFVEYEILKRGLAEVLIIGQNTLYADVLKAAEKEAKEARLGIWSQ